MHPGGRRLRETSALLVLIVSTSVSVPSKGLAASPGERNAVDEIVVRAIAVPVAPVLDGVLDEALWKDAPLFDQFIQQVPDTGMPASERTEVRIVYTPEKLYFGVVSFYSEPERIIANELRYDQARMYAEDDTFAIMLDTFHDHRNGYMFMFNALGARNEWACTDEGRHWNRFWDPVWKVATQVGSEGWSAEVEIPFKSLRYRGGDSEWGINLRRSIMYKNEWIHATPISPAYNHPSQGIGKLSSAAVLEGLQDISENRNLELKPFAVIESRNQPSDPQASGGSFEPGIDIKYGFTPSLNLDLTLNTDFSHVEVDEQQINLTRFGLFFPEKRQFFQEGMGIFDFGVRRGDYRVLPFFSRRIGLEDGDVVPIPGGGRVTGRIGPYSLGALGMRTGAEGLHPATSFSTVRLKRNILQRSSVGMLWTDRRAASTKLPNSVVGLDANLSFLTKSRVDLFWVKSSGESPETSTSAHRAYLLLESDLLGLETDWMHVGDAFNPEVGFVQRADMDRRYVKLQVSPRPRRLNIRKIYFRTSLDYVRNLRGLLETRNQEASTEIEFDGADLLTFAWRRSFEALEQPFRVAGLLQVTPGSYRFDYWTLQLKTSQHRNLSATVSVRDGGFFDGSLRELGAATRVKLNQHLFFDVNYATADIRLSREDLRTHLVGLRSSVALNTRLFGAALVQWNSVSKEFGVNLRVRYTYRPGSDIYVVFNERMSRPGDQWFRSERNIIIKWTYLLQV